MHSVFLSNQKRQESGLSINGKFYHLRLSLGAISALETAMGVQSLLALVQRFSEENYTSADIIHVLQAGLYGAGITDLDIAQAHVEGGARKAAETAMELLIFGLGVKVNHAAL